MRVRGLVTYVVTGAWVGFLAHSAYAGLVLHHGDPENFQIYVEGAATQWRDSADPNGPQRDKAWVETNPDAVLAEGRAACAWLHDRPDAPALDPSGASEMGRLMTLYAEENAASLAPDVTARGRQAIVEGAWHYLCPGDVRDKTAPMSTYAD